MFMSSAHGFSHHAFMAELDNLTDPKILGRGLYRLRTRADMSQDQAAERLGISAVSWSKYENAGNKALTDPDLQTRAAQALGFTREELLQEAAKHIAGSPIDLNMPPMQQRPQHDQRVNMVMSIRFYGPEDDAGLYETGEPLPIDLGAITNNPYLRAVRLPNDDIAPFCEEGGFVCYDTNGLPRKRQYVIVRLKDGGFLARRYDGRDDDYLYLSRSKPLTQGEGWEIETEMHKRADIAEIWPIRLRGD